MEATQTNRSQTPNITKLYDAALKGDTNSLLNLLQEDPLILDRCIIEKSSAYTQSPLHVAANAGHTGFTEELLKRKPELAEEVDQVKMWSPLHVASAKGHLQIIKALLNAKPQMGFAYNRDGRTPIHVAAVNGKTEALDCFLKTVPTAVLERTTNGETVYHLCVKNNQPDALRFLVEITDENDLLNSLDNSGNTAMHLAVAAKKSQMVECIVGPPRAPKKVNDAVNKNRMTALDIYLKQNEKGFKDENMEKCLKRVKAKRAKEALSGEAEKTWLENQRSAIMVVASLIATMAFQAGLNPPGGVYQETKGGNIAGEAIWSYYDRDDTYKRVLKSNTVGLISSLSVMLLLISGLPFKRQVLTVLRVILWISVTATSITYLLAINYVTTSNNNYEEILRAVRISILTWVGVVAIIFMGNATRFVRKVMGWQRRQAIKNCCKNHWENHCCTPRDENHDVGNNGLGDLEIPNKEGLELSRCTV